MEQTEGRRQISNRETPAHAEKVFHYFQKGLSRFQSRHTWSSFHFFTILYNFSLFFSLKLHRNREWNHMLVFLCVSLFEQTSTGAASTSQCFCSGVILEQQKKDGGCFKTLLQNNFIFQFDGASVKIDASLENAHAFHYSVLKVHYESIKMPGRHHIVRLNHICIHIRSRGPGIWWRPYDSSQITTRIQGKHDWLRFVHVCSLRTGSKPGHCITRSIKERHHHPARPSSCTHCVCMMKGYKKNCKHTIFICI